MHETGLLQRLLVASLWLSCIAFPGVRLQAQEQPAGSGLPQPVITTDRPAITDSSTVVPSGILQFENGFAETGNYGQRSFDFPETLVRFGLTSSTELRVTPPDYFQNSNEGSGFASGWGDLSLGLKQQVLTGEGGFDAVVVATLSFPVGASAISSHGYDPSFQFAWSHALSKNWTAAGMFSLLWPTQGNSRNATGQASFLLDRQISGRWDAFVEYGGEFPERGGPQHVLHTGTALKMRKNQQIDFHVGFGVSSAAVDHFVGVGYSFQLQPIRR